ncbi:MAG: DUF4253 domain-containing protein [Saprospiraceae bacterium]|jgi:hypothetical protein|nr:DUF4253 domain-containing protein [Saprospiraceae bacterium]
MSKQKLLQIAIEKLQMQKFGFSLYDVGIKGTSYRDDVGNEYIFHGINYQKEVESNVIFYFRLGVIFDKNKYFFKDSIVPQIHFDKVYKILAHSKIKPLLHSIWFKHISYEVDAHPAFEKFYNEAMAPISAINFRTETGGIDEAQLDKAIGMLHEVMEREVLPFFDAVSTIEAVNRDIIDKYPDDFDRFITNPAPIKQAILLKLGNNPNYESFKNAYIEKFKKTAETMPNPFQKLYMLFKNVEIELEKAENDPHYFDAEIPEDIPDSLKPNGAQFLATLQRKSPKKAVKKTDYSGTGFTAAELDTIVGMGFDPTVLNVVNYYKSGLMYSASSDSQGDAYPDLEIEGISFDTFDRDVSGVCDFFNERISDHGYRAWVTRWPDADQGPVITILRDRDDMTILRYQYTNGANYSLGPNEIIARLTEWRQRYGIGVFGAGYDWVAFSVRKIPADLDAFVEELIAFCPDYLEQDFYSPDGRDQSIRDIKESITFLRMVRLWWD